MSINPTAAEVAARHHQRATRFFWCWLAGATLVSLAGNITHAVLTAPGGSQWLAAAVATVPPTVLLCAVHGIAVLVKVDASGAMYRASVTATGPLAVGAFLLSFVALRDLAVLAGIAPEFAAVLPLVIDVAVAVANPALVAVGDKPAARARNTTSTATPTAIRSAALSSVTARSQRAESARADAVNADVVAPGDTSNATAQLASELVAAKVTRQPVETVEAILVAHENGDPLNRIAAAIGVHHSAVKRVLGAAEVHRQGHLLALV
jgi:hypothetical protein